CESRGRLPQGSRPFSDPEPLAQLARHAAAHLQRRLAATQPHEVLAFRAALDALEILHPDERVAVYAYERRTELALEQAQRILDQILAAEVTHGGVFLVGEEVLHLLHGYQAQPVAPARGDVTAARAGRGERLQLRAGETTGAGEGGSELLLAHRFQQVADGM